jgi:acetyltransferase EpsM
VGDAVTIVGTGGHARVVVDLARACGWEPRELIDPLGDAPTDADGHIFGLPVRRGLDAIGDHAAVAVAIGNNTIRQTTVRDIRGLAPDVRFPAFVHPSALLEVSVTVADGAQVCIGAILTAGVRIDEGVLVNSGALIDHEGVVGAYAHISPGARLAGRVTVGARAHIGTGASVIPGKTIGADAIVGAGAVVINDIPPAVIAVGVPARVRKAAAS